MTFDPEARIQRNEYGNEVFAGVVFEALERRLARSATGRGQTNPDESGRGGAR